MQLGVSTWVWTSPATTEVLETLLPHIASLGFDVIELPIESVGQFDVARVGELARAHGLDVSVCAVIGPGRGANSAGTPSTYAEPTIPSSGANSGTALGNGAPAPVVPVAAVIAPRPWPRRPVPRGGTSRRSRRGR